MFDILIIMNVNYAGFTNIYRCDDPINTADTVKFVPVVQRQKPMDRYSIILRRDFKLNSKKGFKMNSKSNVEKRLREIKRRTRRKYSAEDKIRIVLEGLGGESSIAELCPKEGINQNTYYRWSKDFLEAGKKRLKGDTEREANTNEVQNLHKENSHLKHLVVDISLKNSYLKKGAMA